MAQTGFIWSWNCEALFFKLGHYYPYFLSAHYVTASIILALQMITVHSFYAWRCYILYGRRWYVPVGILCLSAGGVTGLIGLSVGDWLCATLRLTGAEMCQLYFHPERPPQDLYIAGIRRRWHQRSEELRNRIHRLLLGSRLR